jgi:hypothetical protein
MTVTMNRRTFLAQLGAATVAAPLIPQSRARAASRPTPRRHSGVSPDLPVTPSTGGRGRRFRAARLLGVVRRADSR